MKHITLRDIAKIAKVSHATVSLALRKHPRIPKRTRERIEKIAKQIGYRPDPTLSALIVYRLGLKRSTDHGTLAWINTYRQPEVIHQGAYHLYFEGARERCTELGYRLEEFRLVDLEMNFRRLSKVLYSRNIQGLLMAPQEHTRAHISARNFDWSRFSAVALGFTLERPQLHVITNAQFRSARLAVQKLRSLGYRRIGCISNDILNQRTDSNFLAGFMIEQSRLSPVDQIPIFTMSQKWGDRTSECRKWYCQNSPDAIVDMSPDVHYSTQILLPAERRKCGIVSSNLPEQPSRFISDQQDNDFKTRLAGLAGIHQNNRLIGRVAIDEVVALIHANQRGIPETPKRILIEGSWMDGSSAPRIKPAVSARAVK